jgi:hypothetical protein
MQKRELRENGIRGTIGDVEITENRTGRVNRRAYLVLQRQGGDLSCIVGSIPDIGLTQLTDEIQKALSELSQEALIEIFSRDLNKIQRFVLKDLIPDARKCIINGLANNIDSLVKNSIGTHHELIMDFIQILQEAGEQPPPFIMRLFHILFFNEFYGLLTSYYEKTEIDLNDLTQLASLCDPSSCGTLSKSPMVKGLLRWQIDSFIKTKESSFLDNIMNILTMIRKLNVDPDLWEIQNMFCDLYQDPEFVNSLQPDVLAVLKDLGRILGFSIQEMENA